ncbi:tetratricopeptide repeat protein [Oscillatoria sp. CS-180]|uniref:tetratricopeptide repeat protein n=1 Tax=Oscillatoria sp. CS-180 TaxID=3021720 RepID=UPI002330BCCA|nr:tetratricopeptide repeat protein [Oscillatoria sp. CS-180]MDB9527183.1 tetratricopeptide repeat protein [Oscillatoria sp. CS-180]
MTVFFKIGLTLLIALSNFGAISASSAATILSSSSYFSPLHLKENSFLKEKCFSADSESLESCKELILQDQLDFEVWNQLGRIYYGLENYENAYLSFKYATSLRTDYAIAWSNTCAALNQLQDYEAALNACNKSLDLIPISENSVVDRTFALSNKAIVLYFLGRYQESLETLDQTLSINPDNLEVKLNRLLVLHALKHEKNADNSSLTL